MTGEIIALADLTDRELAAWAELAGRAISPNPFMEPGFVLAAARGLRARDVGVLVVRERDEWRLALAVRRQRSWHGVPGRCLSAWCHIYCFLGTPLVAAEQPEASLAAMTRRALAESPSFVIDLLQGDGPLAGPLAATLGARARVVTLRAFERAMLRRHPDGPTVVSMSSRHRANHRRTARRLQEQLGETLVRERSADPDAYEEFLALESSGWKGAAGTALACDPGHAEFFREVCRTFAAEGRLELLTLGSEHRTVAMMCNLRAGEGAFGFKMAYDQTLSRMEPGIQLVVRYVEHFDDTDTAWLDSSAESDNRTLGRIWPDRRPVCTTVAVRRGPTGLAAYEKWRLAAAAVPLRARLRERWAWARRF